LLSSIYAPPVVNLVVPPDVGVSLSPVFTTFPSPTCAAVTLCGFEVLL